MVDTSPFLRSAVINLSIPSLFSTLFSLPARLGRRLAWGGCARLLMALGLLIVAGVATAQVPPSGSAAAPSVPEYAPTPSQVAAAAAASGRTLVAGRDYLVLASPMPAPADRLEVAYFFWYNSPTTAKMDPVIRAWAAKDASPLVKFRPLPAVLEKNWSYGSRVFFTLLSLDKEAQLGPKLVQAIDQGVVDYNNPLSLQVWLKDQGVSPKVLARAINSPAVVAQTSWIPALMHRYGVERVPTVVMDGQFLFVANPKETPQEFVSRISFASQVLTQRKLQAIAKARTAPGAR